MGAKGELFGRHGGRGAALAHFPDHDTPVWSVACDESASTVFSGTESGRVHCWDVRSASLAWSHQVCDLGVVHLWPCSADRIGVATAAGVLQLLDLRASGRALVEAHCGRVVKSFWGGADAAVAGCLDGTVVPWCLDDALWDPGSCPDGVLAPLAVAPAVAISSLAPLGRGGGLVCGTDDGMLNVVTVGNEERP